MSAYPSVDRLFEQADNILDDFQISLPPPELRVRGSFLIALDDVLRHLIELGQTVGAFLGFGLWLVQILVNRRLARLKEQFDVYVGVIVGIIKERGLEEAEKTALEETAFDEFRKLGLDENKAREGARRVLALLASEFPTPPPMIEVKAEFAKVLALVKMVPDWQIEDKPFGCSVRVDPAQNQTSWVHVISKGKDPSGDHWIEFQGLCGKADPSQFKEVLKKTARLNIGAFTLRPVEGVEYFILQERLRLPQVTFPEVKRIIPYLATQAAAIRAELFS